MKKITIRFMIFVTAIFVVFFLIGCADVGTTAFSITVNSNHATITPINNSSMVVGRGEDFSFSATADSGYSVVSVTVSGVKLSHVDRVYTVYDITNDITINVNTARLAYSITLPTVEHATIMPIADCSTLVYFNGSFSFKVTSDVGYTVSKVTSNDVELAAVNGVYTISNITANQVIAVTLTNITYTITLPNVEHATITPIDNSAIIVAHGGSFSFKVTSDDGYTVSKVTANDVELAAVNGVYTIRDITANQVIAVTLTNIAYTITLPTVEHATITPIDNSAITVAHGGSFSFTVTSDDGYVVSKVTANGVELAAVNGVYTIRDITVNQVIAVTLSNATCTITLPNVEHATITPTDNSSLTVARGGSFSFTVTSDVGYAVSKVTANGVELTAVNGVYTIRDITANQVIAVTLTNVTYIITLPNIEHVTITPTDNSTITVARGGSFSFTVTSDVGYAVSKVTSNGVELTTVNGVYTINNIIANQNIAVSLTRLMYDITLPNVGHATITPTDNSTITVARGGSFSFTVASDDGYTVSKVTANSVELTAANGVYTINNITANQVIAVTLTNIAYTITLPNIEHVTITPTDNSAITVAHGGSFSFTVACGDGYTVLEVTANGILLTAENGIYMISDITANQNIAVSLTRLMYDITLPNIGHATITPTDNSALTVVHGGSFSFTVTCDDGYTVSKVTANGILLTAENGIYTISDITANQLIDVEIDIHVVIDETYAVVFHYGNYSETVKVAIGNSLEEPIPSQNGKSFLGWYNNQTFTEYCPFPFVPTKDCELFAKWHEITEIYNIEDDILISLTHMGLIEKELVIPYGVTMISDSALSGSAAVSITISDTVLSIGYYAFARCAMLEKVTFGANVEVIDEYAFSECTKLKHVTLSNSLTAIYTGAFAFTALEDITIPSSVVEIWSGSFANCSRLSSITFEDTANWHYDSGEIFDASSPVFNAAHLAAEDNYFILMKFE